MGKKTNMDTARLLLGLAFEIEFLAVAKGIAIIRETDVADVRKHFLGKNPKGEEGKLQVQRQCRTLGWKFDSPDAADALAVWSYACALVAPGTAIATTPLFQQPGTTSRHRSRPGTTGALLSRLDDIEDIPL
jgi:Holliday junction resolvasome RuvABC endonuclease subunit